MKRKLSLMVLRCLATTHAIVAAAAAAQAQVNVSVPFKFEAGGKSFPPGEYSVELKPDGAIGLRPAQNGVELVISAKETLKRTTGKVEQPELVFDMVGNFEPSFSEYVTDYLLSEVWLPGADGVVVLTTSGKHDHRTVTGRVVLPKP